MPPLKFSRPIGFSLLGVSLVLSSEALAEWPRGAEIKPAAFVDITDNGFDAIAEAAVGMIPNPIPVPDIYREDQGELNLFEEPLWSYSLEVTNLNIDVDVDHIDIQPTDGTLEAEIAGFVSVNSEQDPFHVTFIFDTLISNPRTLIDCDTWLTPFQVNLYSNLALHIVDDVLIADMGDITYTTDLTNDNVEATDCWLDTADDILDFINMSPLQIALNYIEANVIQTQFNAFKPTIEAAIEDAFAATNLDMDVPLGGANLHLALRPDEVVIDDAGARVIARGSLSSLESSPCVAEYGHTGSLETPSDPPALGAIPFEIGSAHAGLIVSDDFLNQALFAIYDAGILCREVTDTEVIPISSNLLTLLSQEGFGPLFPEEVPMIIKTRPANPLTATPGGGQDATVEVTDFGVDFVANIDGRNATMLGLDLNGHAGASLLFDEATGKIGLGIQFSGADLQPVIRSNEFAPGYDQAIVSTVGGLVDSIVGPLLGGLLENLQYPLPTFNNAGIASIDLAQTGPSDDFLGAYANVGEVPYTNELGCGNTDGCQGGCGTSGFPGWSLLTAPLAAAFLRRRR